MRGIKYLKWQDMLGSLVPWLVMIILIAIFFGRKLIPLEGNFICGMDVHDYHFWNIYFFRETCLSGSFPLWNPYSYCGHPFLANPVNFVLYPFIVLYLIFPLTLASNIDIATHFFIAGMGIFLLVRTITESTPAGLVSAVIYVFSGHMTEGLFAGHLTKIHAAAILPWVFYFIEKSFGTGSTVRYLILSGVMLGLQVLTGNNQDNVYTAYLVVIYFMIRYFVRFGRNDVKHMTTYMLYFLLIPITSFGLSAVQLVPSWEFISLSDRAQETYDFATFMSFMPRNFFTFLVPRPETELINTNWEFGAYVGILPLFLAGLGMAFSDQRRMTIGLFCMLLISLTLMLGSYTPIYKLYYHVIPLIAKIRVPARAVIVFTFLLSVLAGLGVKYVLKTGNARRLIYFCCPAVIILLTYLYVGSQTFHIPLLSRGVVCAVVIILAGAVLLMASPLMRNRSIVAGLLLSLVFIDLYLIYHPTIPVQNINTMLRQQSFEQVLEQDKGLYRVMTPITVTPGVMDMSSRGNVFQYYNVNGYIPIALKDFYQYMHSIAGLPVPQIRRHTLDRAIFHPARVLSSKILGIKYAVVETPSGYTLRQAPWHMPRAILCHEALVVPDREEHMAYIRNPRFNPTTTVLLEKDNEGHAQTLSPPGQGDRVEISAYTPNRIELRTSSAGNTYLLLSELYYPGWKAFVDGKQVPVLRADYLLRAVPLHAGQHTIDMVFRPVSLYIGATITGITLLLLCWFFLGTRKRGEESAPATPS